MLPADIKNKYSFLTVVKVADRGAVLPAGGVVDLPCVPPGLRRNLFFRAASRTNRLARRTLGPANTQEEEMRTQHGVVRNVSYASNSGRPDLRLWLGLLDRLPGQSDGALE